MSDDQLLLPVYPLLQEALMESDVFQAPYETAPAWSIAKSLFRELITVIRAKVRWPGDADGTGLDKEDKEAFDIWRRDAGEVIVGA